MLEIAASLLVGLAAFPVATAVEAPSFEVENTNYRVSFDGIAAPVVQNECQGRFCGWAANNIASVTMHDDGGVYVPITVVVEKLSYDASVHGIGWNIRPSHLQEEGVVTGVNASSLSTSGSISFKVSSPCQLSVELGKEDKMFKKQRHAKQFTNLIIAVNPPESSFPKPKPTVVVDPVNGALTCVSAQYQRWGHSCIVAHADDSCDDLFVPMKTDIYFTNRVNRSFLWGDGCGSVPKKIKLGWKARLFLDEDVVIFARVVAEKPDTGIYGYGIISNFHMYGQKHSTLADGVIAFNQESHVFGVIVMDSTYRNIRVGKQSSVEWTKSFAWESQTDGVELQGIECTVRNNFFKVNDDVLKAYQTHTIFTDNVIWHQFIGRAVMLSWGNAYENRKDRDGTTQILRTSIIHDYSSYQGMELNPAHPEVLDRQRKSMMRPSLISAQHSMDNDIGRSGSPLLIRDLHVEGRVGIVMAMSTGYKRLGGNAPWQASNGCGGNINVRIENLDLRRVRAYRVDSLAGGCNQDDQYPNITNAVCLCTTELGCGGTQCHVDVEFVNMTDSEVSGVPRFADVFHAGYNTHVDGLDTPLLI